MDRITIEDIRKLILEHREIKIVEDLEIRDTSTHRSDIANITDYSHATVFIHNELDQDVTIQVKGNWKESYEDAVNIGSSFTVTAGSSGSYGISVSQGNWLPYVFIEITASTAPTTGSIHAILIAKPL